ncbi:MAG: hypothetical protein K940chlam2_00950 [Chlamydiae bacterium]|nr:hypothetical protein [Chlamydiota bacterium]
MTDWTVVFSESARKQYEKLKRSGSRKPLIIDAIDFLALDLQPIFRTRAFHLRFI